MNPVEYRTVEITKDRYVEVPGRMTKPVEIVELPPRADFEALPDDERFMVLEAARKAQKVRAQQCNGQLAEIRSIAGTLFDEG